MGLPVWTEDPRAPEWGQPPLPGWAAEFRPHQLAAVQQVMEAFAQGHTIVVLEAPTGSGKTLVAEMVRRLLKTRALYTCVDRGLQDQVLDSFPYAKVLKGRRNYPTVLLPDRFNELDEAKRITADDCNASGRERPCDFCLPMSACPYQVAKRATLSAALGCTNLAYLLTEANGPGQLSGQPCIVVDEADRLEEILMGAVNLRLSKRMIDELDAPHWPLLADVQTPGGAITWDEWLDVLQEHLQRKIERLTALEEHLSVKDRRILRQYRSADKKVDTVREGLQVRRWVVDQTDRAVEFKAVRVDWAAQDYLWQHASKWLLMSATVLNAAAMLRDLGVTEGFAVVRMPSTFPVERRPVYFTPVANVVHKEEDAAVPKLAQAIRQIMARHPEDRILVHVVSYRLMNRLREVFLGEIRAIWYAGADARAETLADFMTQPGAVLFAPALDRGLDLPDELCRAIVICKIPYPSLGDQQVKARVEQWSVAGREWYVLQTLRTLIQMTGRGMRHADDFCTSYILDNQLDVIRRRDGRYLPKWWTDALVHGVLT